MRHSLRASSVQSQGQPDTPEPDVQGNEVSLIGTLLREAIDESGWKHEALAEVMALPSAAYLSRMLSGEKAIGAKHLLSLPDDVEVLFAQKYAEAFGLIVVQPSHGQDAVKALVSGLFGVLGGTVTLPIRAASMAKAVIAPTAKKVGVR